MALMGVKILLSSHLVSKKAAHDPHDDKQASLRAVGKREVKLAYQEASFSRLDHLILLLRTRRIGLYSIGKTVFFLFPGSRLSRKNRGRFGICLPVFIRRGIALQGPVLTRIFSSLLSLPGRQVAEVCRCQRFITGIIQFFPPSDDQIYIHIMDLVGNFLQELYILQLIRILFRHLKRLYSVKIKSIIVAHDRRVSAQFSLFADQIVPQRYKCQREQKHGYHNDRGEHDHHSFSKSHMLLFSGFISKCASEYILCQRPGIFPHGARENTRGWCRCDW